MTIAKKYEAGDVRLLNVILTNGAGTARMDISAQLVLMSIFEDIEQPTMYAELTLVDSLNLVKDFPIIGEETIEISFFTPGRDRPSNFKFRVFSVEGNAINNTGTTSAYVLKAVSQEHFVNNILLIDKTYNTTCGDIVLDVLLNELKTQKKMNVESTRGIVPLTIPFKSPFEALDMIRQRAIAKRPSGGVFVFFENQFGFNFVTLEKLLEDGKKEIKSKTFTYYPIQNTDKERERFSFRNIQRLQHLTKFDSIEKLSSGLFKNNVRSLDLLTKSVTETEFRFNEQLSKFATGEKKTTAPNSDKFMYEAIQGAPVYMFTPKDSSKGNDFIGDLLGYRDAFTTLFNQNVVRGMVYGDNYLSVGDLISIELPDVSGTTEKKAPDERFSGNYLITKLRHMINLEDRKFKYNITFDCNKVGYNS